MMRSNPKSEATRNSCFFCFSLQAGTILYASIVFVVIACAVFHNLNAEHRYSSGVLLTFPWVNVMSQSKQQVVRLKFTFGIIIANAYSIMSVYAVISIFAVVVVSTGAFLMNERLTKAGYVLMILAVCFWMTLSVLTLIPQNITTAYQYICVDDRCPTSHWLYDEGFRLSIVDCAPFKYSKEAPQRSNAIPVYFVSAMAEPSSITSQLNKIHPTSKLEAKFQSVDSVLTGREYLNEHDAVIKTEGGKKSVDSELLVLQPRIMNVKYLTRRQRNIKDAIKTYYNENQDISTDKHTTDVQRTTIDLDFTIGYRLPGAASFTGSEATITLRRFDEEKTRIYAERHKSSQPQPFHTSSDSTSQGTLDYYSQVVLNSLKSWTSIEKFSSNVSHATSQNEERLTFQDRHCRLVKFNFLRSVMLFVMYIVFNAYGLYACCAYVMELKKFHNAESED